MIFFPQYIIDTNFEKCVRTAKALHNMTRDNYERDGIASFYEWTLYHTILRSIDVADDIPLDEISRELCINKQGMDMYDYLNNVDNYLDFLSIEEIYALYKKSKILENFLHIDVKRYIELMPIDIQEEHKIQKEMEIRNMEKRDMVFNITGGQVNLAKDNAIINATQNNGISGNELDVIINAIKENLSGLKKEEADEIINVVDMAREELTKSEPKTSRLRNCITLIAPMITIANGIPTLASNLQKLQEFIMQCIK